MVKFRRLFEERNMKHVIKSSSSVYSMNEDVDDKNKKSRNLEWKVLIDKYVKATNDFYVFMYDKHHWTKSTKQRKKDDFLFSADAHCAFEDCSCRFHCIILNGGKLVFNYLGSVNHSRIQLLSRPIRASRRIKFGNQIAIGATPGSLRLEKLKSLSTDNRESGNRNVVRASPSVIRKIASDQNVKLS
ncbi:unnamed protein product, partial [Didymodactylos carnosus]